MTPRQLLGFIIGPVATAAVSFISVPLISWFFLPEDIGRIAMLQIAVTFGILLLGLGLDQALVREYYDTNDKSALLLNTTLPGVIIMVLGAIVLLVKPHLLSELLFDISSSTYSQAIVLCILLALISRSLSLILRLEDRGIAYSLSQFLPKLIFLLMVLVFVAVSTEYKFHHLIIFHTISISIISLPSFGIQGLNARKSPKVDLILVTLSIRQERLRPYSFGLCGILGIGDGRSSIFAQSFNIF